MRYARATVLMCCAGLLVGCRSNPFELSETDRANKVPERRLREIADAELSRFAKPKAETPVADESVRRRFDGVASFDLGIEAARKSALEHNLQLKVALVDPAIARERVNEESAKFEKAFTLRSAWQEIDNPTASTLTSATSQNRFIEPGVKIPTITGGTATVTLPMARNGKRQSIFDTEPCIHVRR